MSEGIHPVSSEAKRRMVNKLLMMYLITEYKKVNDEPLTEDRLMMLVYLAQKSMEAQDIEGFTYEWEWRDDE